MSEPESRAGGLPLPKVALESASTVPAYALVIVNLLIILAAATQAKPALAIVIAASTVGLSAYVIWIIERRAVLSGSAEATGRLQAVKNLEEPIRCVLDELVREGGDVYIVYSSTEQREFLNQLGETVRPEGAAYGAGAEKRATTIPDAIGAGRIRSLMYLGGKRDGVRSITAWPGDFQKDYWDSSLVLIGSGKSNRATTHALAEFDSPYRFADDFDAIVDRTDPGRRWPADPAELATRDYGLLVKLKVERASATSVYIVAAGVGPYGTLAACVFLEQQTERIYRTYGTGPFAYVLSVRRDDVSGFAPQVERECPLAMAAA